MYTAVSTRGYRKAYKQAIKRKDFKPQLLKEIIIRLTHSERLDPRYQDHQLTGEFKDYRECHIAYDLLLVYQKQDDLLILLLIDLGSHDEVFG